MVSDGIHLNENTSLLTSSTNYISPTSLSTSTQPVFFIREGHQVRQEGISLGEPKLLMINYLLVLHINFVALWSFHKLWWGWLISHNVRAALTYISLLARVSFSCILPSSSWIQKSLPKFLVFIHNRMICS